MKQHRTRYAAVKHAIPRQVTTQEQYVVDFDILNHLIPTPIIWVTPTLGNFA